MVALRVPGEPLPPSFRIVLSTADDSDGKSGKGPLSFNVPRRIVANGFVDVRETTGFGVSSARCIFGAQIPDRHTTAFTTPQNTVTVPGGSVVRMAVADTFDSLTSGTYEVVTLCRGGANATIEAMTLNAIAADQ